MFYIHLFPCVMYMSADSVVDFTNQKSVFYVFFFMHYIFLLQFQVHFSLCSHSQRLVYTTMQIHE